MESGLSIFGAMQADSWFASRGRLGILGGGQLGKMILEEAIRLDITVAVMDAQADCACSGITPLFHQGQLTSFDDVLAFGKQVDVLTIEIENVNTDALSALEDMGKKVFPRPATIALIQDKGEQKEFYFQHEIPTADFKLYEEKEDVADALNSGEWSYPVVWRACTGGYDGRGVQILRSENQLQDLPDVGCFLEEYIPIEKEFACLGVRSSQGEVSTYPVVGMRFHPEANQVEEVYVPGDLDPTTEKRVQEITVNLLEKLGHVGLLAVEFIIGPDGELLVNEAAPRPHNSGHIFSDTTYTSHFEQHIRAVFGMPLGSTRLRQAGSMINLVGVAEASGPVHYAGISEALREEGVYPHLYGKKDTRPFRKMGHVNVVADEIKEARERAARIEKQLKIIAK